MAYDLQEQEQLDELKAFWRRWGGAILAVLLAAALAFAGVRLWRWHQVSQAGKAQAELAALHEAAAGSDAAALDARWATLKSDFPATVQASIGALEAAAASARQNRPEPAIAALQWLADAGADPEYRLLGRLRLAGLLLDANRHDDALKALDGADPKAAGADMDGAFADRRADVLLAMGRRDDALAAWDRALGLLNPSAPLRALVQLKREALGQ